MSPSFLRKDKRDDEVPSFMREFAGVVRRRSGSHFNPNESAPPKPGDASPTPPRPQSAVFPSRKFSASAASSEVPSKPATPPVASSRRKSDFMARYEELAMRANAALSLAENFQSHEKFDGPMSPEPEEVEFNEEEVLKTCKDFLKDYDNSKRRKSLTEAPVPKPRESLKTASFVTKSPNSSMEATPPIPSLRSRSSSLTLLDKRSPPSNISASSRHQTELPKPILKKSSEDLNNFSQVSVDPKPIPILKHKDSDSSISFNLSVASSTTASGILKKKATAEEGPSRPDHIRIRSPSPDLDHAPRPILRSRNNSTCDERMSSPEPQSILKRRSSTEDLDFDTARSSPEPQGILKRKYSSAGTSGSHSPESMDGGYRHISSILKKQGSLEDVDMNDEKIKSILKKRQASTDDELEEVPVERPRRSILKSKKSEESLSPLSDPNEVVVSTVVTRRAPPIHPTNVEFESNGVSTPIGANPDVKPRPILKHKESREDIFGGSRSRTLSPSNDE